MKLKSLVVNSLLSVLFVVAMISGASASPHTEIPNLEQQQVVDLAYFERKQERCLDAFSRSDFDIAYSICSPLANLGYRDAQLITGLLYAYGEGVDKNLHRAKIWLKEALRNGREDAAKALTEFGMD